VSFAVTLLNQLLFRACATSTGASTVSPCSLARCSRVIFTGTTNYKTGSDTGSVTLTRDPTWPGQNRWPDDPVIRDLKTWFQHCSAHDSRCLSVPTWPYLIL